MKTLVNPLTKVTLSTSLLITLASCNFGGNSTSASDTAEFSTSNSVISTQEVTISQDFQTTTVVEGLQRPWGMTWLPDGTILITERPGRLRVVRQEILESQPVAGVPEVLASGQGGLLDISAHPDFAENNWIYLTYAHGTRQANRTRVARAKFDGSALRDLEVIFEVAQAKQGTQHFGSRITWLPDKTMVVAFGDGGNPPIQLDGDLIRNQAQNLNSYFGKVVRINDDGSIPEDNPFVGYTDVDPALWSYGHRNIQGMTVDSANNRIWATEHGAKGGDELNWVAAGENYGWPEVSYSDEYSGGRVTEVFTRPDTVDPKVVWIPSIAPSGLAFYSSDRFAQWQGDLFAGGLVSRDVRHLDLDEAGKVLSETSMPIGQRVRDVRQAPNGGLYVLTDDQNGKLIRIEPK